MIRTLSIQNYAIIEKLEIRFSEHLTIITGETGAGKSIILGALGLILGKRAESKVLYNEAEKCVVEAVFDVSAYSMQELFEEADLDYEPETVVRREITPNGKSRAFINDTPVNLATLQRFSEAMIDLHQQFDTLDIQDTAFQMRVLDALAGHKPLVQEYTRAYRQYDQNRKKLDALVKQVSEANRETDFIQFQLDELLQASLMAGEQEELEVEQRKLANAEDIQRILNQAGRQLTEDENAIASMLSDIAREVQTVAEFHPDLPKLSERLEALMYELEDISGEFQAIADDTEYDGERLGEIDSRLVLLFRLQKKHNVASVEELIEIQENLQSQLGGFEYLTERIAALEIEIDRQEKQLFELAKRLHDGRQSVIQGFENQIHDLLGQLSMPFARLCVELTGIGQLTASGTDAVQFLFSANKGSRLEAIKSVASGGELSRLALCVKSLVASAIPLPTLIFDEIDSGVSGEVALQMGLILQKLSSEHQVITITHSPQIAAKADLHYFVHKVVRADRTHTSVRLLEMEERVLEIAKMLSGNPPSEYAQKNARELLGEWVGAVSDK